MTERIPLTIDSLLDSGAREKINDALQSVIHHCIDRPKNGKKRRVSFIIDIETKFNEDIKQIYPYISYQVDLKLPGSEPQTIIGVCEKGGFTINEFDFNQPLQDSILSINVQGE